MTGVIKHIYLFWVHCFITEHTLSLKSEHYFSRWMLWKGWHLGQRRTNQWRCWRTRSAAAVGDVGPNTNPEIIYYVFLHWDGFRNPSDLIPNFQDAFHTKQHYRGLKVSLWLKEPDRYLPGRRQVGLKLLPFKKLKNIEEKWWLAAKCCSFARETILQQKWVILGYKVVVLLLQKSLFYERKLQY